MISFLQTVAGGSRRRHNSEDFVAHQRRGSTSSASSSAGTGGRRLFRRSSSNASSNGNPVSSRSSADARPRQRLRRSFSSFGSSSSATLSQASASLRASLSFRRRRRRSSSSSSSGNDASNNEGSGARTQPSSQPHVDKRIVCDLLHLRLKQIPEQQRGTLECLICADEMKKGCLVTRLPCGHLYHSTDCILPWLERNATCPTCRFKLRTVPYTEENIRVNHSIDHTGRSGTESMRISQMDQHGQGCPNGDENGQFGPANNGSNNDNPAVVNSNSTDRQCDTKIRQNDNDEDDVEGMSSSPTSEREQYCQPCNPPMVLGAFCGSGDMIQLSLHRPA
eukprot:CAMPEP_0119546742 /NCGR_PEP_ID=MMETSP1352-20130426/1026_1 /TAXON_ID=265584 /ORGANISM="Stauroneis constricta, Strain CCMP1120" /LENGTH=335 /DNA_ID=CAMNT_0007591467 /DNA_START=402 /DNA_END=1409 /DNA_ORIENTATION=-